MADAFCTSHPNEFWHYSDGTTRILLNRGKETWIDTVDYCLVKPYRWHAVLGSNGIWYVGSNRPDVASKSGWKKFKMHQIILPLDNLHEVDHEDGDGLNNRRYNLRSATRSQNAFNRRTRVGSRSSLATGIHWCKRDKRWIAQIGFEMRRIRVGGFLTERAARKARFIAEQIYHPEFERLAHRG